MNECSGLVTSNLRVTQCVIHGEWFMVSDRECCSSSFIRVIVNDPVRNSVYQASRVPSPPTNPTPSNPHPSFTHRSLLRLVAE